MFLTFFFLVNILHWFCSTSEALKTPRLNAYYLWWLQLPSKFCSKTIVKRHLLEFLPFCESFNFFDNFFTLNLVLHKANIRLFQFDFHSEFKSFDHLLVEILILIMVITNFILYYLATMSPLGWHPPHLVDNKDTQYLGDQHCYQCWFFRFFFFFCILLFVHVSVSLCVCVSFYN